MSKKSVFETIQMPAPCDKNWNEMTGGDAVRFCDSCGKNVHNISALTRREAKKLLLQSTDKPCIRLTRDARGNIATANPKTHQLSRLAAGILGASITLSAVSAEAQQTAPQISNQQNTVGKKQKTAAFSQISFTLIDPNNNVAPGVTTELTNQKTKEKFLTITDATGTARFERLPRGRYEFAIPDLNGFLPISGRFVEIKESVEPNIKIALEIGTFIGVISYSWYEIPLLHAVAQNDVETIKRLITEGANINEREKGEQSLTALHVAVETGNVEITRLLLDKGAKANAKTKYNQTPLMMIDGDTPAEIAQLLVERGANVNAQNKRGETALMQAADEGNFEIVRLLIEAGAQINAKDDEGETALDKATDDDIELLLKTHGAVTGSKN